MNVSDTAVEDIKLDYDEVDDAVGNRAVDQETLLPGSAWKTKCSSRQPISAETSLLCVADKRHLKIKTAKGDEQMVVVRLVSQGDASFQPDVLPIILQNPKSKLSLLKETGGLKDAVMKQTGESHAAMFSVGEGKDKNESCIEIGSILKIKKQASNNSRGYLDKAKHDVRLKCRPTEKANGESCMCELCGKLYANNKWLAKHLLSKHQQGSDMQTLDQGQAGFTCLECRKHTFTAESSLKRHVVTMHMDANCKYQCEICSKSLTRKYDLKVHMENVHMCKNQLLCALCGIRVKGHQGLAAHMISHSGDKPYKCGECGNGFCSRHSLNQHRTVLHRETNQGEDYICEECGKSFATNAYLKRHERSVHHKPGGSIYCNDCNRTFMSQPRYITHRITKHEDIEKQFCCFLCCRTFAMKCNLYKHLRNRHFGPKSKYAQPCTFCDGEFLDLATYLQHVVEVHNHQCTFKDFL